METQPAPRQHAVPDARPPSETVVVARHAFDGHGPFDAGKALQLFGDEGTFHLSLHRQGHMLPIAAAASARSGMAAGRRDAAWRGFTDGHGVGAHERACLLGDAGENALAWDGVAHESDSPVGQPCHAASAGGRLADDKLDEAVGM